MAGVVHEEVQPQRQLDQAGHTGGRGRPDDRRVSVKTFPPREGGAEVSRQWPPLGSEGRPSQAEHLGLVLAGHDHDEVAQTVPGGHEVERLVDELEAAGRAGQQARQLPERPIGVIGQLGQFGPPVIGVSRSA